MKKTRKSSREIEGFLGSIKGTEGTLSPATFLFDQGEITIVRVPARLDVMGGIADYSGANVCEGTLDCGVVLGLQQRKDEWIRVLTLGTRENEFAMVFTISISMFYSGKRLRDYNEVKPLFDKKTWAAYIVGSIFVMLREHKIKRQRKGFNVLLYSSVPMSVGIGSSATVEIATIHGMNELLGLGLDGLTVSRLGQITENRVVGAPCGLMDQIAVTYGRSNHLIHILCQPGIICGEIEVPEFCTFVGINSMVKHSVAGDRYTDTRIGTFMGRRIITQYLRKKGIIGPDDLAFDGYLANLSPHEFEDNYSRLLPLRMRGAEFLKKHGPYDDQVTEMDQKKTYAVRKPTAHPIYENWRVINFMQSLSLARTTADLSHLERAGQYMFEAHQSYVENCDMSCPEVDLLVDYLRKHGRSLGIFGAKITGGGCGGTVALLCRNSKGLKKSVSRVVDYYCKQTGFTPDIFYGSSPGALEHGVRKHKVKADH